MRVAVLDIGKTAAKVVIVEDGVETAEARCANDVRPGPPYPHHDADALWSFALDALGRLGRGADAVVPVAHGACAALVAADGSLALPVLDYEHDGPETARATYTEPPFAETGTPRMANGLNVGAALHWLEAAHPEGVARARHLLMWPQWWAFRLSGVPASEVTSLACHTGLWAPREGRPSSLATARGWDRLIPPLRRAWEPLGPLAPDVAAATGLDPGTPVLTGIHDSNASILPYLAMAGPRAVVSTGTWIVPMALGSAVPDLAAEDGALLNCDALGRPVPTAPFMGGRAREEAIAAGTATGAADRAAAERTAERLSIIGAAGPVHVEGPFAANRAYLDALGSLTGRPVLPAQAGAGTTRGAALLAEWRAA